MGHGSADWRVTWVTGHKMWPIVSSAVMLLIVIRKAYELSQCDVDSENV